MPSEVTTNEDIDNEDGGVLVDGVNAGQMNIASNGNTPAAPIGFGPSLQIDMDAGLQLETETDGQAVLSPIGEGGELENFDFDTIFPGGVGVTDHTALNAMLLDLETANTALSGADAEAALPAGHEEPNPPEVDPNSQQISAQVPAAIAVHWAPLVPPPGMNWTALVFFRSWRKLWLDRRPHFPSIDQSASFPESLQRPPRITASDLAHDLDFQGLKWSTLQTTKEVARHVRRMTVKNYTHMLRTSVENERKFGTPAYQGSFCSAWSPALPDRDDFFRFRQTFTTHIPQWSPHLSHPQLRHNLCAPSRHSVFYCVPPRSPFDEPQTETTDNWQVRCLDGTGSTCIMAIGKEDGISCLSADHGVLVAGSLQEGRYTMKALHAGSNTSQVSGTVNTTRYSGVNHIQTFVARDGGSIQAAVAANDSFLRVVDVATNRIIRNFEFEIPVNTSAISPDGRLRLLVSDDKWPLVTDAETGEILARLPDHKDHGFACAWSPDGITMATGHEDGLVQIWDARQLGSSIHAIPAEQGGIRTLSFSPLGSGHPVLVMAESVDFVSVVDARTFQSKQDIHFFGEISGIAMPPDNNTLFIGNGDTMLGGIMEFERSGHSSTSSSFDLVRDQRVQRSHHGCLTNVPSRFDALHEFMGGPTVLDRHHRVSAIFERDEHMWMTRPYDWSTDTDIECDDRVGISTTQRRRRYLGLQNFSSL